MSMTLSFPSPGNTRTPSCRTQLRKNRTPVHSDHRRVHDFPHFGLFPCRACTQNAVRGRFAAIAAARGKRIAGVSRGLGSRIAIVRAQMQHTPPFEGAYVALQYVGGRFCNLGFDTDCIHSYSEAAAAEKKCKYPGFRTFMGSNGRNMCETALFTHSFAKIKDICAKQPVLHRLWDKPGMTERLGSGMTEIGLRTPEG